jgi:hypothetical protein
MILAAFSDTVHEIIAPSRVPPAFTVGGRQGVFLAVTYPSEGRIVWTSNTKLLTSAAQSTRWTPRHEVVVEVLVHEHLHIISDPTSEWLIDRNIEEAVVSATAADLLPRVVRRLTGRPAQAWRTGHVNVYPHCAERIRAASAIGSGVRSWRQSPAKQWRMRLLHADASERRSMITSTGTPLRDVCPEAMMP